MHDIAPNTTSSDRAARRAQQRRSRLRKHGAPPHARTEAELPAAVAHAAPAESAADRHVAAIADLDEGDVLLHVLGTGLGPMFCAFVCGLAVRLRLRGWARCESGALTIRAVGREPELAALVHEIRLHAPADCSVRAIEPDAGDGGASLPEHGFMPIGSEFAGLPLATSTTAASGPDW